MAIYFETEEQRAALTEALDVKLASIKRALNTSTSPRFKALYDEDFRFFGALRNEVAAAPIQTPEKKK